MARNRAGFSSFIEPFWRPRSPCELLQQRLTDAAKAALHSLKMSWVHNIWGFAAYRLSVLTLPLITPGCAGIWQDGISKSSIDTGAGRNVEVGYFQPDGRQGHYAVLTKPQGVWQVDQISRGPIPMTAQGQEQLFVGMSKDNAIEITPIYGSNTAVHDGRHQLQCEPSSSDYSACSSAFTMKVPLEPNQRKVDRGVIELAIQQSNLFERLKQSEGAEQADQNHQRLLAFRRSNIRARVVRVENTPQAVAISPEQAQQLVNLQVMDLNGDDSSFRVRPSFAPLLRSLPTAEVTCSLQPEKPEDLITGVTDSTPSALDVVARVESCSVFSAHPIEFVASEAGSPLSIRLVSFSPTSSTALRLSNSSNAYLTISSISVYYAGKIFTQTQSLELPPTSSQEVSVLSQGEQQRWDTYKSNDLAKRTFEFGFAAKYASNGSTPKTLLSVRQIPVKEMLPVAVTR